MPAQFTYRRRVQFAETDMAGIVHFSYFYRYMEETEHEFFRSHGLSMMAPQSDGSVIGWPRVRASCAFEKPVFYDDLIDIELTVHRRGVKSLTMRFDFFRDGERLANGEVKTVCCLCPPGKPFFSIPIPESYQAFLVEGDAPPRPSE